MTGKNEVETAPSGAPILAQGRKAYSKAEIRALASSGATPHERAQRIATTLNQTPPEPETPTDEKAQEPSSQREPAASTPEEAPSEPAPSEQDSDGGGGDGEAVSLDTLEALAEQLDVDVDALHGLKATVKVNGETQEMSLGEALQSAQHAKANAQRTEKLVAAERQFEAERGQQLQAWGEAVQAIKQRHIAASQVLEAEFRSPEVQALREQSPADYLRWQEMKDRRIAELESSFNQISAYEAQVQQEALNARKQAGIRRLREAIPDIDSSERQAKLEAVFVEFGGTGQDMRNVIDERLLILVNAYAEARDRVIELETQWEASSAKARQLAEETQSAQARPQRKRDTSKKKLDQAKANMKGKRGYSGRKATQQAIFTALQEKRRGR